MKPRHHARRFTSKLSSFGLHPSSMHLSSLRRRCSRHGGLALRHVNEPDLAALLLEIEVARAPVERGEEAGGDEESRPTEDDCQALALRRQIQSARERFYRSHPTPAVERLNGEDRQARPHDVEKRRRDEPLPAQIHQLIVAIARERPAQPEVYVEKHRALDDEDDETQEDVYVVIAARDLQNARKVPAAEEQRSRDGHD